MARCFICDYCQTTGSSLSVIKSKVEKKKVRYYKDLNKYLCDDCAYQEYYWARQAERDRFAQDVFDLFKEEGESYEDYEETFKR